MSEIPSRLIVYRHLVANAVAGEWFGTLRDMATALGVSKDTAATCVHGLHEEGSIDYQTYANNRVSRIKITGPEPNVVIDAGWTNEDYAILWREWPLGTSTTKIGAMMSPRKTKNSIIGKSHRLKLPPRPSSLPGPNVTDDDRAQILSLVAKGDMPLSAIGAPYGLSREQVKRIAAIKPMPRVPIPSQEPVKMEKPAPAAVMPPMPAVNADRIIRAMLPMAYVVTPQYQREMPVAAPRKPAASGYGQCRFPLWPDGAKPTHVYCDAPTDPDAPLDFAWCKSCRRKVLNPTPMRRQVAVAY